jgi:hypothetical protein
MSFCMFQQNKKKKKTDIIEIDLLMQSNMKFKLNNIGRHGRRMRRRFFFLREFSQSLIKLAR